LNDHGWGKFGDLDNDRGAYFGTTKPRAMVLRTVLRSWPVRSAIAAGAPR
jgi:hypothetical protein